MEIDPEAILKYLKSQERFKGELAEYWAAMKKLPVFDYSKFYSAYPEYSNNILQGDCIRDFKFIQLPDEKVTGGLGLVTSNSCDIEQENARKFPTRIIYAPVLKLAPYIEELKSFKKKDAHGNETDEPFYSEDDIKSHINDIRNQKVHQIFYLPSGASLSEEAMVVLDNVCSSENDAISRENLAETRMSSLSMYGWLIFLEKLSHFFTRFSNETVELRLKTST